MEIGWLRLFLGRVCVLEWKEKSDNSNEILFMLEWKEIIFFYSEGKRGLNIN